MKAYLYTGKNKEGIAIGSHGILSHGDEITVCERDAYYMRDDKEFRPKREQLPEDFPEGLLPTDGAKKYFDLSSLHWKSDRLFRQLRKFRRAKLLKVLQELESIGFPVPHGRMDADPMRDLVAEIGRKAGWI